MTGKEHKNRSLLNHAVWSMLSQICERGALILVVVYLSNSFNLKDFAVYNYFQLTVSMLAAYAAMGVGVAASKFFAEFRVAPAIKPPVGMLLAMSLLIGSVGCIAIAFFPSAWVSGDLGTPNWVFSLGVAAMVLNIVPSGAIMGLERYKSSFWVTLVAAGVLCVFSFFAVDLNQPILAITGFIVSRFFLAAGNFWVVSDVVINASVFSRGVLGIDALRRVGQFVGPMFLVSILAGSGTWAVGRLILMKGNAIEQFAIYSIGLQWYALTLFVPGVISRVLLPKFVHSREKTFEHRALLKKGVGITTGVSLLVVAVGACFSGLVASMYGGEYKISALVIVFFLAAAIPAAPLATIGNAIVVSNKQLAWLCITVVWFLVLVIAMLIFSDYGALGGAVSLFIASLTMCVASVWFVSRKKKR